MVIVFPKPDVADGLLADSISPRYIALGAVGIAYLDDFIIRQLVMAARFIRSIPVVSGERGQKQMGRVYAARIITAVANYFAARDDSKINRPCHAVSAPENATNSDFSVSPAGRMHPGSPRPAIARPAPLKLTVEPLDFALTENHAIIVPGSMGT
jgi:hypothetical protein